MKRTYAVCMTSVLALSFIGAVFLARNVFVPRFGSRDFRDMREAVTDQSGTAAGPEEKSPSQALPVAIVPPIVSASPRVSVMRASSSVPFTAQAPAAQWSDPLFQNACEEASMVMAAHWLSGAALSKDAAQREIAAIAKFEKKKIGHSVDTSVSDTEKLFRAYYGQSASSEVSYDFSIDDMVRALSDGAILIVPTNGQLLGNPNFTAPGPEHHMVVVIGYDAAKKEFIVNDPGTRKGAGYRYPEDVLYGAIHDYPTGDHLHVANGRKAMILVSSP